MKTTQNARLLQFLKTHKKGITTLEAFNKLGICRLSERCRELEGKDWRSLDRDYYGKGLKRHYHIKRKRETIKGRHGIAHVIRYSLA